MKNLKQSTHWLRYLQLSLFLMSVELRVAINQTSVKSSPKVNGIFVRTKTILSRNKN